MTYFFAEDKKISGKLIQLISRSMDIIYQSANQSANQSVCPWQTDLLQLASEYVRLSLTDRLTFINDLFRFRRYKKSGDWIQVISRSMDISGEWIQLMSRSVDIKDQSASQPVRQSVSQSVGTWQTNWLQPASQSVCPWQTERLK